MALQGSMVGGRVKPEVPHAPGTYSSRAKATSLLVPGPPFITPSVLLQLVEPIFQPHCPVSPSRRALETHAAEHGKASQHGSSKQLSATDQSTEGGGVMKIQRVAG